jgi:hypothetical protein
MFQRIAYAALCLNLASPALAEVDVDAANSCLTQAISAGTSPADCVNAAQDYCLDNAAEAPAVATLCFNEAQGAWSKALGAHIKKVLADADETVAAVVRIETKYDLLVNLLHCDRIEELSVAASDITSAEINLQKTRCQSSAAGLAYAHLFVKARNLPDRVKR